MSDLPLIGYECLTVILPLLVTFWIMLAVYRHKKMSQAKTRFLMLLIFALYISAVFYFTGAGTIYDLMRNGILIDAEKINYFSFSRDIDVVGYFLNILLFVPFGVLVPLIWSNKKGLGYTLLSGFSFSLLIELSQLFNNRQSDVDDLLLNTLGALIGYLLFRIFANLTKKAVRPVNHLKCEGSIYIFAMFLGHFLMFNELCMAKIIYGL